MASSTTAKVLRGRAYQSLSRITKLLMQLARCANLPHNAATEQILLSAIMIAAENDDMPHNKSNEIREANSGIEDVVQLT